MPDIPNDTGRMIDGEDTGFGVNDSGRMVDGEDTGYGTEDNKQEDQSKEEEKRKFPSNDGGAIFGLPPVDGAIGHGEPHPISGYNGMMSAQNSVFMNSFPILTLLPVEVARPKDANGIDPAQTSVLGGPYKFAIQNNGNISYSLTNNYGESMIEDAFNSFALSQVTDLYQSYKTSRLLNSSVNSGTNAIKRAIGGSMGNFEEMAAGGKEMWNNVLASANAADRDLGQLTKNLGDLAKSAWSMIIGGQKIDIPNVWKGSSAPISQTVNIVLHSAFPDNDNDFHWRIIKPLTIIFALSSPYSKKSGGEESGDSSGGEGSSDNNDIVTYENPPYLEAEIDGVFKSRLCAITSCNIEIPYNRFSLAHGGRPYVVNVQLTITDLYNAIVWSDTPNQYAPNGLDIVRNLATHDRDSSVPPIDKSYMYYVIPNGGGSVGGGISSKLGGIGDLIGSVTDTVKKAVGIVTNVANVVAGADPSAISQGAYQVAHADGYTYYSDNKPLLSNELDRSNADYNKIVDDYLDRHQGGSAMSDKEVQDKWNKILFEYDNPV